jgi:D-inositol-3-phosphate glycosyltransferase
MNTASQPIQGKAGKNIVILGSAHPLRGGGIATFNERLARAFILEGDFVKILCL